jgi:catechol 2,3-dioxygenase-like lactoylglutathione lyase family enzyme
MTPTPHHLAGFVADVEALVAFYRRAFGFREVYRLEGLHSSAGHCWQIGGRWLELGQSGFYLEVFPLSRRPGSDRSCVCGSQNYLAL